MKHAMSLTTKEIAELSIIWGAMHDLAEQGRMGKNEEKLNRTIKSLDDRFEKIIMKNQTETGAKQEQE